MLLQIDRNVQRELLVHCQLQHPNIVGFKRVRKPPSHCDASVFLPT